MTIIRAPREERFTVLNRTIIADERISYRALGLLVFLLDKPDNWRVEATALAAGEGREGREAVQTALKELQTVGYLMRQRRQDEAGHWITESFVYESPGRTDNGIPGVGQPTTGKPDVGSPVDGFPVADTNTVNDDGERTLKTTTPPSPRKRGMVDEDFERWWELYPKKQAGKGQAREKWRKMTAAERRDAHAGIARHNGWWAERATDAQFIPAASVWLNQRRWEDDEPRSTPIAGTGDVMARARALRQKAAQT